MPHKEPPRTVEDVVGPWTDPDFQSSLIERCRHNWCVQVAQLSNEALATFLRQRIAIGLIAAEAVRRLAAGTDDGSEMYEGELAEALRRSGEA
jgi:hypothetical protein